MSKSQLKAYALRILVKPTSTLFDNHSTYKAVTIKGISIAKNPTEAKERGIRIVLNSFTGYDGSSISRPLVARENLTVKECKVYGDFITSPNSPK